MAKIQKQKRKRRSFDPQFKAEAVRLCKEGDRTVGKVADSLDLTRSVLQTWVDQSPDPDGTASQVELSTQERDELTRLRKENKRLLMEREILKKAAAFFAKEST